MHKLEITKEKYSTKPNVLVVSDKIDGYMSKALLAHMNCCVSSRATDNDMHEFRPSRMSDNAPSNAQTMDTVQRTAPIGAPEIPPRKGSKDMHDCTSEVQLGVKASMSETGSMKMNGQPKGPGLPPSRSLQIANPSKGSPKAETTAKGTSGDNTNSGNVKLDSPQTGKSQSGDPQKGVSKSQSPDSGHPDTENDKSGSSPAGHSQMGKDKSGNSQTGNPQTRDDKSGNSKTEASSSRTSTAENLPSGSSISRTPSTGKFLAGITPQGITPSIDVTKPQDNPSKEVTGSPGRVKRVAKQFSRGLSTTSSTNRRLCDDDDELSEVEPDAVPSEVRDWLALTFTRSMSNIKRRGDDKPRFRSVAHAIRAGIMVDRYVPLVLHNIYKYKFSILLMSIILNENMKHSSPINILR